jgi:hypothetical protein
MAICDSDGRYRADLVVGAEVPASLVRTEGVATLKGNLSSVVHSMSRARKKMDERPDPELEAHLRHSAGREWVEEAAEDEKLTELLRRRRLDMGGRVLELVHRGERVRAETQGQTFSGQVIYGGSDFATLDRGEDLVEVVLDAAIWSIEPATTGGHEQSGTPLSLRARLAEVASDGAQVRLVVSDGRAIVGSIDVVATDHVQVSQDSNVVVIPVRLIAAVIRPKSRS